MAARWWIHSLFLLLVAVLPVPFLAGLLPLPPWAAGADPLGVAIAWGMAWVLHAAVTSLGVKLLELRLRGTLALHAGLMAGVALLIALVWPRR